MCLPVRESLSLLDIPIEIYPCPIISPANQLLPVRITSRYFPILSHMLKKPPHLIQLPVLMDPNTDIVLEGNTDDIILYLHTTYARKGGHLSMLLPLPAKDGMQPLAIIACTVRKGQPYGLYAQPSLYNAQKLRLYGVESHTGTRLLRERLCSLQLSYEYIPCAEGGTGRVSLIHQINALILPVLYDQSTNVLCFGVDMCLHHLKTNYDCTYMFSVSVNIQQELEYLRYIEFQIEKAVAQNFQLHPKVQYIMEQLKDQYSSNHNHNQNQNYIQNDIDVVNSS